MDQKLTEIVSTYINIPGDQITGDTVIDRSKVSSSIVLHRMYAKLAENGYKVDNYWNIKTFDGLLKLNNGASTAHTVGQPVFVPVKTEAFSSGIDIEEIEFMPLTEDFRESDFYKMNFAPAEIAYCILQSNPYASFAGLFALKEAIVKCDNSFKNQAFNTIHIAHSPLGKPTFRDFQVSLSHTDKIAVAIAMQINNAHFQTAQIPTESLPVYKETIAPSTNWIAWLALILSIAAILITLILIKPFS